MKYSMYPKELKNQLLIRYTRKGDKINMMN
jgi:hypothetical protein